MIYFASISPNESEFEVGVRITTYLIHIFTLVYIREHLTKMKEYFDEKTTSPSDFSILMTDLAQSPGQKSSIRKILSTQYNTK